VLAKRRLTFVSSTTQREHRAPSSEEIGEDAQTFAEFNKVFPVQSIFWPCRGKRI
jgi:hypothetical protein